MKWNRLALHPSMPNYSTSPVQHGKGENVNIGGCAISSASTTGYSHSIVMSKSVSVRSTRAMMHAAYGSGSVLYSGMNLTTRPILLKFTYLP